jgi:GMP synthase-like glutamine amidotransferase
MKPVAIFRHYKTEGPGYFATFLDRHSIPWQLIAIDQGETVPASPDPYSGIALLGGPMSVNDPLPWIEPLCALLRAAIAKDIPVIGHCLGAQLMSKALGGHITPSPFKEIGWGSVHSENNASARRWLGDWPAANGGEASVFQWHGETFSLPAGAERLFRSPFCDNQMFALGPHLGMQCHVEMSAEMIEEWCAAWPAEVEGLEPLPASVQTPAQMLKATPERLPGMRLLAEQLYTVWLGGLKREPAS